MTWFARVWRRRQASLTRFASCELYKDGSSTSNYRTRYNAHRAALFQSYLLFRTRVAYMRHDFFLARPPLPASVAPTIRTRQEQDSHAYLCHSLDLTQRSSLVDSLHLHPGTRRTAC